MSGLEYQVGAIPARNSNQPHGLPNFLGLVYHLTENRGLAFVHHLGRIGDHGRTEQNRSNFARNSWRSSTDTSACVVPSASLQVRSGNILVAMQSGPNLG